MSWCIKTKAGCIDLEDSSLLMVERSNDRIIAAFDSARLYPETSKDNNDFEFIDFPKLVFSNVKNEEISNYVGNQIVGKHESPSFPLDYIYVVEYEYGMIKLSGSLKNSGDWYIWKVEAKSISIHINNSILQAI